MIKYEEALKLVKDSVKRLEPVDIRIENSEGRVLAENIKSGYNFPPFNKSAMDGYAVRSADIKSVPVKLKCRGMIKAGSFSTKRVGKGECIKIMTGAPLPAGADCVVMVEDTGKSSSGEVKILKSIQKQENVCRKGENVRKEAIVLEKGTVIRSPEIAIASGLGRESVKVYRTPSVAVVNTGDEITEPGKKLVKGRIYNSNGPMVMSFLKRLNVKAEYLGIAVDEKARLLKLIKNGLKSDIFIITGGVSMGDYDFVPETLKKCGVKRIFHKVYVKPGKPVYFGKRGKSLVFGMPGNPVSTYLALILYVKTATDIMKGISAELNMRKGVLQSRYTQRPGRKCFFPVRCVEKNGEYKVYPVKGYHGSADIYSLPKANAFMIIDGKVKNLKKGSTVDVLLW